MKKKSIKRAYITFLTSICLCGLMTLGIAIRIHAKTTEEKVKAQYFEFEKNSKYEVSDSQGVSDSSDKLGELSLSGDMKSIADVNGIKAYSINDGNIRIKYIISNTLVNATDNQWHLEVDKSKNVDGMKLKEDVLSGAVIVQTSLTGDNWITDAVYTDIANSEKEFNELIYTSRDIQQVNGCYYRVLVVYNTKRQIEDKKMLFWNVDNFEEKKRAEEYIFYLVNGADNSAYATKETATPRKELGFKINTGKDNGFSGNEPINDKDPHFGWNIGTFFVNGYTRETASQNGTPIFLKNVGDRVTLWFGLSEDINCLRDNEKLSINEDKNGSDQYFEIEKTNFKHGALIIRYTDYEGKKHEPIIYEDFLAASARTGSNTKVELFEEGDYEVALDYEINDARGVTSKIYNYRVYFEFSIRNGNCMVYPFDNVTGAELADNAITENGFKLDMAKSRYLTIDVKKTTVKSGSEGFSEDVRFNRPAKDGESYNDEGIYTFTVKNLYTGSEPTTKTIYIGNSPIIKALASGLTLEEINTQISDGAELLDDGTLFFSKPEPEEVIENTLEENEVAETTVEEKVEEKKETTEKKDEVNEEIADDIYSTNMLVEESEQKTKSSFPIAIGGFVIATIIGGGLILIKKKKNNYVVEDNTGEEGKEE